MNDETETPLTNSKPRTRSPAYPAISLKEALDKARIVWSHEKRNAAPLHALAADLEMNPKSSSFNLAISALKKYGLMEEIEGSKERSLRLTTNALNILLDDQEDSPQRMTLLKQCALTPAIYAKLWKMYNGELPSDATLTRNLIVEMAFNPTSVDKFTKDFRDTIAFSKLTPSDKIEVQQSSEEDDEEPEATPYRYRPGMEDTLKRAKHLASLLTTPSQPVAVTREFTFPLPTGTATLKVPFPLSEEDFDNLMRTIGSFKDGLVKKPEPVVIECVEGWQGKASALADSGLEINLTNFDYSFDIEDAKEFSVHHEFDLRLDPNKKLALFRKRIKKGGI